MREMALEIRRANVLASPLALDARRAEQLLFDLATDLRRAPVRTTLRIQLRALQIKRAVSRWLVQADDEATRRAVIGELLALQGEVRRVSNRALAPENGDERRTPPPLPER